jgi:putative tryptophan/tyrosine transport system substrate-binding protein
MRRREFITLLGVTAAAWPLPLRAQQAAKVARVGLLSPFSASTAALWHDAFRQGLQDLGWVEGRNIIVEYRYADGRDARLPELALDLVRIKVDIIVTSVQTDTVVAKNVTRAIPIVMASAGDAVGGGLVESLARPGGNITGLSQIAPELGGKRLELLKEIVPKLFRVAVLWNPRGATSPLAWQEIQRPARQLELELYSLQVHNSDDFDKTFEEATRARADALAIMPDPLFAGNLTRIANLSAKARLPSIFHLREFADNGGLVAYGVDRSDMFRRAAGYVDSILRGANPAELPVQQPTKLELVINLKTAKALGIEVPATVLVRADEVIE